MALPTSMSVSLSRYSVAGITLEVYPSTVRGLMVEIQSATANSTVSTAWNSHIIGPSSAGALRYTVQIPASTKLYYFRARHPAGAGYSAGGFTATVSARPMLTPIIPRPFSLQMTYQGNAEVPAGSDVFVSSGKTVKVGTQVTTGTATKKIRVHPASFIETVVGTERINRGAISDIQPTITNSGNDVIAPVVFPKGVTLRRLRALAFRGSSQSTVRVRLYRITSTGGSAFIATAVTVANGWSTIASSTIAQLVGDETYSLVNHMRAQTATSNAKQGWVEIEYTMPDYLKAY